MRAHSGVHYVVLPGAGSAGKPWRPVADQLDALILPIPDEPDVPAMASALIDRCSDVPRPRVLVGASLGAMVALEIAREVPVDALVLVAAGFGISVSDSVLDWVASDPPDLLEKVARAGVGDPDDREVVDVRLSDFNARGQGVLLRHLGALKTYLPQAPSDPPPTVVVWGCLDRSVPLEDHVQLAVRCKGILAPVTGAGHASFLERPQETVSWLRFAALYARAAASIEPRAG
jgi:pimeloyl-ACP methyl ester carboxylesterase